MRPLQGFSVEIGLDEEDDYWAGVQEGTRDADLNVAEARVIQVHWTESEDISLRHYEEY